MGVAPLMGSGQAEAECSHRRKDRFGVATPKPSNPANTPLTTLLTVNPKPWIINLTPETGIAVRADPPMADKELTNLAALRGKVFSKLQNHKKIENRTPPDNVKPNPRKPEAPKPET